MTGEHREWHEPASVDYALDEPEFMVEFGRAMAEWGGVEHELSSIFATALETRRPHHARAAFHTVISFRDRLGLVDAPVALIANSDLGETWSDLAKEWSRIKEAANQASRHRNALAHMHVWHSPEIGTFGWKDITRIEELPIEPSERKKKAVTVQRMRDYRKSFSSLQQRLRKFDTALAEAIKTSSSAGRFAMDQA